MPLWLTLEHLYLYAVHWKQQVHTDLWSFCCPHTRSSARLLHSLSTDMHRPLIIFPGLSCSFRIIFSPVRRQKTALLLVVVYGCETWSLTLKEECGLRLYENMVLSRIHIFVPEGDEITWYWRRQRDEELHGLYSCHTFNGDSDGDLIE